MSRYASQDAHNILGIYVNKTEIQRYQATKEGLVLQQGIISKHPSNKVLRQWR